MRTSLPAAAPSSGRRDSFRLTGPAQAAARDLPGRRERQARRGNTSSLRHGAVWKNAGEAAQRAAGQLPLGPHFRGLPLDEGPEEESLRRPLWWKSPGPSALHQEAEGRRNGPSASAGARRQRRSPGPEAPSPARVGTSRPARLRGTGPALPALKPPPLRALVRPAQRGSGAQAPPLSQPSDGRRPAPTPDPARSAATRDSPRPRAGPGTCRFPTSPAVLRRRPGFLFALPYHMVWAPDTSVDKQGPDLEEWSRR
nr:PREDICTED: serine/arginine repetitive matrix protein 1-like [Equus przewalskii]